MSYVKEKVSYLRGLCDGLGIEDEVQRKMYAAIIDTLDAVADALDENEATIEELDECVSDIYDALDDFEDELYGDEEDEEEDDEDDEEDDEDAFDEDDFIEVKCPHCGETIYFDQEMLASTDELICPSCNEKVVPAVDEEDE
jgi:ribosomal protein S27E